MRICGLLLLFLLLSCKARHPRAPSEEEVPANATHAPAEKASADPSPDFALYLFDDEEKIATFPKDYIDAKRAEYTSTDFDTDTDTDSGTDSEFDEGAFLYGEALELSLTIAELLADPETRATEPGLGLAGRRIPIGTEVATLAKKYIFMANDAIVSGSRRLVKGKGYRKKYFEKAIVKKRDGTGQHHQMAKIEIIDQALSSKLKGFDDTTGANVHLGMLPDGTILREVDEAASAAGKTGERKIISVVQDFEREVLQNDAKLTLRSGDKIAYTRGRSKKSFKVQDETYGFKTLNQYSTPDRTMMSESVTRGAIDDVLRSLEKESPDILYVHCKSGKGRSASIVVGARVAQIIEWAARQEPPIRLTTKEIDILLDEQIAQVKAARPQIGISPAQRNNLRRVLHRWIPEEQVQLPGL